MRARLAGSMSINQINELYPAYDYDANKPILSGQDWSPLASSAATSANSAIPAARQRPRSAPAPPARRPGARSRATLAAETAPGAERAYAVVQRALTPSPRTMGRGDGIGSNSWVVGGNRTSTGKPLLANDPHLGVSIPGIWYQVGLHCRVGRQRLPVRRRRLLVLRAAGRRHRPQPVDRLGLHQPRPRRQRLLPRAGAGRHLPARRQAGPADDAHGDDQDRRRGRADRSRSAAPCTARSCPTPSRTSPAPVDRATGQRSSQRRLLRGRARSGPASRLSQTADAIFGLNTRPELRRSSARPQSSSRCRRRTCSMPTRPATSATRRRAGSRSAAATWRLPRASGSARAGTRRGTGRATCRSTRCRTATTRPRASSSRPTRR